ncbi:hypothetical protein BTHER_13394 [Brochothrix thermosphacta DSM 20171 = FSL F6-1036]|nr:hypothetical protein BTHER_13394 [Brochothrix thermosphacta DSM 20171 = FSL F6-1036]
MKLPSYTTLVHSYFVTILAITKGSIIYGVGEFSLMPIFPQKNSDIFKIPVKLSHHNKFIRGIRKCQLSLLIISQIPLELQIKIFLFQKRGVKNK